MLFKFSKQIASLALLLPVVVLSGCSTTTPIGSSEVPSISRPGTTYNIKEVRPATESARLCFASVKEIVTLAVDKTPRKVVVGLVRPGSETVYQGTGFNFSIEMIGSSRWRRGVRDDRIKNNPDIIAPPVSLTGVNVYEDGEPLVLNGRGYVATIDTMPRCNGKEINFDIRSYITMMRKGRARVTSRSDRPN